MTHAFASPSPQEPPEPPRASRKVPKHTNFINNIFNNDLHMSTLPPGASREPPQEQKCNQAPKPPSLQVVSAECAKLKQFARPKGRQSVELPLLISREVVKTLCRGPHIQSRPHHLLNHSLTTLNFNNEKDSIPRCS